MNTHTPCLIFRRTALFRWLIALLPALCLFLSPTASMAARKYALLIGINDYSQSGFRSLRGARNDIDLVKRVLETRFGFPSGRITELVDGQATHSAIRDAFHRLRDTMGPDDLVYIHYSGHGSTACDFSGDEGVRGLDSTWVPYGSRAGVTGKAGPTDCRLLREQARDAAPENGKIDSYDILDDELNGWLVELGRVTDNIVFVSDSCHSGTVTRSFAGQATRGVPADFRPYNPGPVATGPLRGVRIGACRDTEKAGEYRTGDKVYGMFTWFWANALMQVGPDATWQDLVKHTAALIEYEYAGYSNQHPQIEGGLDRTVFDGRGKGADDKVTVASVDDGFVAINAGSLSGVTVNSLYADTSGDGGDRHVRIVSVEPTMSIGEATGDVRPGDLLALEQFWPDNSARSISVSSELPGDAVYLNLARQAVLAMPQYELARDESSADLVLHIFRSGADAGGSGSAPIQCAVLSPDERPVSEGGQPVSVAVTKGWEKRLEQVLERVSRVRHLLTLQSPPGETPPVVMEMTIWERARAGSKGELKAIGGTPYARWGRFDTDISEAAALSVGDVLTFSLHNRSDTPYYCYLVNITGDGSILPFYPTKEKGMESGLLLPGQTLDTADELSLEMDRTGREYVQLIVSRDPVDIGLLNQPRAETTGKDMNATDGFLLPGTGSSKGLDKGISPTQWATEKLVLNVSRYGKE